MQSNGQDMTSQDGEAGQELGLVAWPVRLPLPCGVPRLPLTEGGGMIIPVLEVLVQL